jgi:hypothetical protein
MSTSGAEVIVSVVSLLSANASMLEFYLGKSERIIWQSTTPSHIHQPQPTTIPTRKQTKSETEDDDDGDGTHSNINDNLIQRLCHFEILPLKVRCISFNQHNGVSCSAQVTVRVEILPADPSCTFPPAHFNSLTVGILIGVGVLGYLLLVCVLPAYCAIKRRREQQQQIQGEEQVLITNRNSSSILQL